MKQEEKRERDTTSTSQISPQSKEIELLYQTQADLRAKNGTKSFCHAE